MTLKRTPSTGKPGRPSIQLSPQDLEDIRQHALGGKSQREIAKLCGVSWPTWYRLCLQHPALKTIIADAYDSIGYESTVTTRKATLITEAEQRGDDPRAVEIEVFSANELDAIYTLSRQGVPPHQMARRMAIPAAMWKRLWESDKRGQAIHTRAISSAAADFIQAIEKPPVVSTNAPEFSLSDHCFQLARNHSILLRAGDIEETEPERSDLMGTVSHWLMHREELSETATGRLLGASVPELREWLAMLAPGKADDELQRMLE